MAEACPDSRRCLPAWMMKPCSGNEVSNTEHRRKQVVESVALDKIKPIRRKIKVVDTEDAGELRALQQCKSREKARRKTKDADHAVNDEFDEMEKITWRNVKKVSGRAAPKDRKKQKLENVGSEASSSGITDDEIELTAGNSRASQRCQGREVSRRKHNNADYAAKDELEEIEKATRKNVTKVSGRAAPKNSRKRKLDNVESEALSSGATDDEIELTVDDLMRIAEEIVNADKEKLQDRRAAKTDGCEEHPPRPPASTSTDTGVPTSSAWSTKGLTQCTTSATNNTPSECRVDESNGYEEPQQRPSGIKMTGDGAQDMLNILLGQMWSKPAAYEKEPEPAAYEKKPEPAAYEKKPEPAAYEKKPEPAAYEKKPEPAAYEKKSEVMEARTINHALAPRKKDWRAVHQVQGELVVAKKKSSLKDKVALFL
uniref:Uncharacterized protein n=1 Tax=Avena sativa TaxID=4498 RepID=A0ACD5TNT1_AVESA